MQRPDFLEPFIASRRTGFYLRVLQEGELGAGDVIERTRIDPARVTVCDLFRWRYIDKQDMDGTRQALGLQALSPTWKQAFAERGAEAGQSSRK